MRCDAPLQRVWAECRSPMRIFTLLIAQANDGLHTHTTHISHFSVFFFFWFVCGSVYHAAHTKAHRAYIGIIQPQHGLSLPCLNMLHHICHLSYTTYGRRRQKKKNYPSFELIYAINRDELMKSTSQTRKVFQSTLKSGMLHTFGIVPDDKLTHSISDHTHNAPENRFIHAAAVIFCIFRLATDWRRP